MLWQAKNASAQMIVFTVLYLGKSVSFVDSLMTKSGLNPSSGFSDPFSVASDPG